MSEKLSDQQKDLLDRLEAGNLLELGSHNQVLMNGVPVGMRSTLMSLVHLGLAKQLKGSRRYRATTEAERRDWEELPDWMKGDD